MLDPGYSPGVADFYGMLKIFGGFAPKKIKENYDCVIMQWNIIGINVEHKIKEQMNDENHHSLSDCSMRWITIRFYKIFQKKTAGRR